MWTTFCLCPLIPSCSVACEFLILFHKHTLLAEVCLTGSHSPVAWGKWQRLMNWLCRPPASPGIPSSACHGYLDLFLEGCLLSKHLLEPFGRSLWLRRVLCCPLVSGGLHDRLSTARQGRASEALCVGVVCMHALLGRGPAVHLCTLTTTTPSLGVNQSAEGLLS